MQITKIQMISRMLEKLIHNDFFKKSHYHLQTPSIKPLPMHILNVSFSLSFGIIFSSFLGCKLILNYQYSFITR
jgi:hypothetical protein